MDVLIGKAFMHAVSDFFLLVASVVITWAVATNAFRMQLLLYCILVAVALLAAGLCRVAAETIKLRNVR